MSLHAGRISGDAFVKLSLSDDTEQAIQLLKQAVPLMISDRDFNYGFWQTVDLASANNLGSTRDFIVKSALDDLFEEIEVSKELKDNAKVKFGVSATIAVAAITFVVSAPLLSALISIGATAYGARQAYLGFSKDEETEIKKKGVKALKRLIDKTRFEYEA